MDLFGIGPLELMLILILALVVFGPGKLPEIAAKLGSSLREMRKATREFSREIDETRQAIEGPINDMKEPMQELVEPFQEAGTAIAGARETIANPSKAIEGYVMGQYASADKPAKTMADEPPPAHPAESADALAGQMITVDSEAAETESVGLDGVTADAAAEGETVNAGETTLEAEATDAAAETEAGVAGAMAAEAVAVDADSIPSEPAINEPAARTEAVADGSEPVESSDPQTTLGEIAVSPDPGVVSAIATLESAFANATPSPSGNVGSVSEMSMAHKMPEAAEAPVVAAASEVAAPEPPAAISPEPTAPYAISDTPTPASDLAAAALEPPQVPAQSTTVEQAGQAGVELPPSPPAENTAVDLTAPPVTTRTRHRAAPRKSASPRLQPPPGEGEALSSDKPASQD